MGLCQPRSNCLPTKHGQIVPQYDDLKLPELLRPWTHGDELAVGVH
jgi:hypothetical protein